jgi:hypothetical protein
LWKRRIIEMKFWIGTPIDLVFQADIVLSASVPALTEWGMPMLAGILGIGSVYHLRRGKLAI